MHCDEDDAQRLMRGILAAPEAQLFENMVDRERGNTSTRNVVKLERVYGGCLGVQSR